MLSVELGYRQVFPRPPDEFEIQRYLAEDAERLLKRAKAMKNRCSVLHEGRGLNEKIVEKVEETISILIEIVARVRPTGSALGSCESMRSECIRNR